MSRLKIVDRVRKLFALAKGNPNAHEAASARKRANALKKKYKVKAAEIAASPTEYTRVDAEPLGEDSYWGKQLSIAVAQRRNCRSLSNATHIAYLGKEAARAAVQHREIAADVNRFCFKTLKTFGAVMRDPAHAEALVLADAEEEMGDVLATRRVMNKISREKGLVVLAEARAKVWITTFRCEAVRAVALRLAPLPPVRKPSWEVLGDTHDLLREMLAASVKTAPVPMSKEDREQLARATDEAQRLENALAVFLGGIAAKEEVEAMIGKAQALGTACGTRIYLGEAGLLGEKKGEVFGVTPVPTWEEPEEEYDPYGFGDDYPFEDDE